MLSGFNVTSLEKYVVDEQLIKMVKRLYKGVDIDRTKDYTAEICQSWSEGNLPLRKNTKRIQKRAFHSGYLCQDRLQGMGK